MLPTKNDLIQKGDLGGEKVAMQLDSNGLAHIMSVLTDLYSDPEAAVLREYSTNAWDSHVEAGITRPIEVNTPTGLNPNFTIKDFGVGLSADDIRNIYSKYGASTKRGTNEQTGMLGLGCKSALTYTNQFTIKAVKDGIMTHVVISRNADGAGTMEIINEFPSDQHNGVEVTIPSTKYGSHTEGKAKSFFQYWPQGSVLLNGHPVEQPEHIKLSDKIWLVQDLHEKVIVMGNVPYPLKGWQDYGAVYFVDMGEVNFTPSREQLHMTSLTTSTIKKYDTQLMSEVKARAQNQVDNAKDHKEALLIAEKWRQIDRYNTLLNKYEFTYKQEKVPTEVTVRYIRHGQTGWRVNQTLHSKFIRNSTVIVGFDEKTMSSWYKTKIRLYVQENSLPEVTLVYNTFDEAKWFDLPIINWRDVKKIAVPRGVKKSTSYEVISNLRYHSTETVTGLDTTKNIHYGEVKAIKEFGYDLSLLFNSVDDIIVVVPKNRQDKFRRDYPQAVKFNDSIKKQVQAYWDTVPIDKWTSRSFGSHYVNMFMKMDPATVLDPDIKKAIEFCNKHRHVRDHHMEKMHYLSGLYDVKVPDALENPMIKYKLVNPYNAIDQHGLIYLNAAYETLFKGVK